MPDKPTWCGRVDEIVRELNDAADPWIDRERIQHLLGVGTRRAQQILAPCISRRLGANGLAERKAVVAHLRRLAAGDAVHYERRRRERLAAQLDALYRERRESVMVEAPVKVVNQEFADLPEGVSVERGHIGIRFGSPVEALQKLLALAMAIRNDPMLFERLAGD